MNSSSLAAFIGTTHGMISAGGPVEKRISGSPSFVPSAATVMSQSIATSQAPASAYPCTAAIVGLGNIQMLFAQLV